MAQEPGKRGTKRDKARRVQHVYRMLLAKMTTAEINAVCNDPDGFNWALSERTIDVYIAEAHAKFEAVCQGEREDMFRMARARLDDLYAQASCVKDALAVQREINELFGLHAPKKTELSITDAMLDAEIARLEAELAARDAAD